MSLFDQEIRIVLTEFKQSFLGNSQELIAFVLFGKWKTVKSKGVDQHEDCKHQPEEGERIDLKVRKECEPQHFQKTLVAWLRLPMEQAAREGRVIVE